MITGSCHRWYEDGSDVITKVPENYLDVIALRNSIEQPSTFWRKSVQDAAGRFDVSYKLAFDWEYWNRLKKLGIKFHRTEKLLSHYYFSKDNLTSRGGEQVIKEMHMITAKYAGEKIADAYMQIFNELDIVGLCDVPLHELPAQEKRVVQSRTDQIRSQFGDDVIDNYNWNWASKQIRGVKWY